MTPSNIHMLNSTLLALPVAVVLTRRLLLAGKTPVLIGAGAVGQKPKPFPPPGSTWSARLKHIASYDHFGINE